MEGLPLRNVRTLYPEGSVATVTGASEIFKYTYFGIIYMDIYLLVDIEAKAKRKYFSNVSRRAGILWARYAIAFKLHLTVGLWDNDATMSAIATTLTLANVNEERYTSLR